MEGHTCPTESEPRTGPHRTGTRHRTCGVGSSRAVWSTQDLSKRAPTLCRAALAVNVGVRLELVGPASRVAAASWAAAVATPAARTLVRLADVQGPPLQLAPVQVGDRLLRLSRGAHLDETEAPRPSGRAIRDDGRRLARSGLAEEGLEVRARGVEGKISDDQLLAHCTLLPPAGRLDFVAVA